MTHQLSVAELLDLMHTARSNWETPLAEAGEARLTYRQGEWAAAYNLYAPLDAHDRHAAANMSAEQARLEFRRGEWNVGSDTGVAEFDGVQARIGWRAGK